MNLIEVPTSFITLWIYTTLKPNEARDYLAKVLLPYEFTLLSNTDGQLEYFNTVLLPYEFTLLSNNRHTKDISRNVLLPYEFTLLSNFIII